MPPLPRSARPPARRRGVRPADPRRALRRRPLVLIVHGGVQGGLGGGPATFARQEALADLGWQVAIVDRSGLGRTPSRGPDDMEADAPWIADMLGDGAHLVGHSWGGASALLAAASRPRACARSLSSSPPCKASR